MNTETDAPKSESRQRTKVIYQNANHPVYGLGIVGAAIYYVSTATTLWMGVVGFLKAIVWPAFLVYETLKYLGM